MSYAELHCLSNFSFQRGASHALELFQRAKQLGYRALAITDECTMAGIVRAHEAAREVGLPLIVGTELQLDDGFKLVALAENRQGYADLCRLITRARRRGSKGHYQLGRAELARPLRHCCLLWVPDRQLLMNPPRPTPKRPPAIGQAQPSSPPTVEPEEQIQAQARFLVQHYAGRCWIAVHQHRHADDEHYQQRLQTLSHNTGFPLVAAGDVRMHARSRKPLLDVMTAIRHRCTIAQAGFRLLPNGEQQLRPLQDLHRLYPAQLLRESLRVAARCQFQLTELNYQYPHELVPAGQTAIEHLRQLTERGARKRWPQGTPGRVQQQLNKELALIAELKFEPFFLTVEDIVRFARSRGILCQGRGSSANSAVCYALRITEVDPAQQHLLFERFISRARKEPPDIDVDFEHERREEVIQYIYGKYGRERAALAATVIRYRPKSAIRDVGKALGLPLDQIDTLTGSWAWWNDAEALNQHLREQGLDPDQPIFQNLVERASELIGFPRHLSQHVGGFVISETPLHALVPIENAAMPERTIIQWDKDDLESLGLLKVDCLALGMLTAIRKTLSLINSQRSTELQRRDITKECPRVYKMIQRGDSLGVFQIESRAQLAMAPRLKAASFYDLVIAVAIVRPGPIQGGMVHPYLRRRAGIEAVDYPSPAVQRVLERTLGVPLFQEQAMELAIVAADFTADEADALRRGMAAWRRRGGLEPFQARLMAGMARNGYSPEFATRIYKQIQGFADYGFPESHACSFAQLAYESAWLKCHHPAAFVGGLINSQPMGFYPPAMLLADLRRAGVSVLPLDVQTSFWDCRLERKDSNGHWPLRLGLRLIKGLREDCVQQLIKTRSQQAFQSLSDFSRRTDLDRRCVKLLADAGALASLQPNRHLARWAAQGKEPIRGFKQLAEPDEPPPPLSPPADVEDMRYDLNSSQVTLGPHPLHFLRQRLAAAGTLKANELIAITSGKIARVAGLVRFRQRPQTASGILFMTLEDETGVINLIVHPKTLQHQHQVLLDSRILLAEGPLQHQDGTTHLILGKAYDLGTWLPDLPHQSRDFR